MNLNQPKSKNCAVSKARGLKIEQNAVAQIINAPVLYNFFEVGVGFRVAERVLLASNNEPYR
jgi:hypothetical protein